MERGLGARLARQQPPLALELSKEPPFPLGVLNAQEGENWNEAVRGIVPGV